MCPPFEKDYLRKDGTRVPVLLGSVLLNGSDRNAVTYVLDITDRKRAEAEREALLRQVEASALQQRAFLRDVLRGVTEGKLRLCDSEADLPPPLAPEGEPVALSAPTLAHLRHRVVAVTQARGFAAERRFDLLTAVGEAGMNAVVHGHNGQAHVRVAGDGGTVQVWLRDQGTGIAVDFLHRATLERGFTTAGTLGHGFWMMLHTCDRVYLLTGPAGTTVVLEQDRESPNPSWVSDFAAAGAAAAA